MLSLRHVAFALLGALTLGSLQGCVAAADDSASEEADLSSTLDVTQITTRATYQSLSTEGGGFGQAGRSMKVLIDNRDPHARSVHFVNGNYSEHGTVPDFAKYHFKFAQHVLGIGEDNGTFNEETYFTQAKKFYAGTIQTYTIGNATEPLYAVQLYPTDVAKEDTILIALQEIKKAFVVPNVKLAFVATGTQQTTATVKAAITALGFEIMTIDEILGSIDYFPLNAGEAWGYLRLFPQDVNALRPTDIPVFAELPLDLSVVAGAITKTYQDVNSHINLKSKERGTPNMALRDAATNALVTGNADKPVHLVVKKDGYVIEPSTDAIVKQKLAARLARPLQTLPVVAESRVLGYDDMCPRLDRGCLELTSHWGGKATGLGFLANASVIGRTAERGSFSQRLGYDVSPKGFGIPVQFYRDFVQANPALAAKIAALVAKENAGNLSPNERAAIVKDVQTAFYGAQLPASQATAVRAQIAAILPGIEKLKIRSSANAEDIPGFDGAGLHDSFAAKPATANNSDGSCQVVADSDVDTKLKVSPNSIECAVKATYASLWNQRAIEERSYARLDQATSAMGIAVVPAHDTDGEIVANAVVITRAVNTADVIGYSLSVQTDDNLVTNPTPGTVAELSYAVFGGADQATRFTTAHYATPKQGAPALTKTVLTTAQMSQIVDIVKSVEIAYCKNKVGYYEGDCGSVWLDPDKAHSLDLELKVLDSGHLVLKQVREFNGR